VASAVKTSGIRERVDHRTLILPPLSAPGVDASELRRLTGWSVRWGPVRAGDLPRYLAEGCRRSEAMRRVTHAWPERLDTALGALFPFYLLGGLGFALFNPALLPDYLIVGAAAWLFFFLVCPALPGRSGLAKVAVLEGVLAGLWMTTVLLGGQATRVSRADLIIAMVMLMVYGTELGGLAPNMPSDLDPFLARLGLGRIGAVTFAGTVRTELLNGYRRLNYDPDLCAGCRSCFEVCPLGVWAMDDGKRAEMVRPRNCTACGACLLQCPTGAITATRTDGH